MLLLEVFLVSACLFYAVECTPESELLFNFQRPALAEVNKIRAQFKLNGLVLDDQLSAGAQDWAEIEAKNSRLRHSCGPCDNFSELLAEKLTTGDPPKGKAAVDWALGRWFGSILRPGEAPVSISADAYTALIKRTKLGRMGIGIAYGKTANGEKTAFAVARFANAKPKYG